MTTNPTPHEPEPKRRNWFMRHKILTAIGAVLLLGMIGSIGSEPTTPTSDETPVVESSEPKAKPEAKPSKAKPDVGDPFVAQVMCEDEFIPDYLTSPSTAEYSEETRTRSGRKWVVGGTVDAENAFGAMVRARFECVVRYVGDDQWRLVRPVEIIE